MLIKDRYILISSAWEIIIMSIDIDCSYNLYLCNHNHLYGECEHETCESLKTIRINDYEVWDKEKLCLKYNELDDSEEFKEELKRTETIEGFMKDNNIKYCFELKIKGE